MLAKTQREFGPPPSPSIEAAMVKIEATADPSARMG